MRSTKIIVSLLSLALSGQVAARAEDSPQAPTAQANTHAQSISDAQAFIAELEQSIRLAHNGDYGKLSSTDLQQIDEAQRTIVQLLAGRQNARQLNTNDRIAIYNAQEQITAIIRNDEKNRKVCKPMKELGTRVRKLECLTVAEREELARSGIARAMQEQGTSVTKHQIRAQGVE